MKEIIKKEIIKYVSENKEEILIESTIIENDIPQPVGNLLIVESTEKFEKVLERIKPVVDGIFRKLVEIPSKPNETKVEFGIKLSAKAGIIISSVDTEANFKVSLTWTR